MVTYFAPLGNGLTARGAMSAGAPLVSRCLPVAGGSSSSTPIIAPTPSADPDTDTNSDPDCLTQPHSFAKPNSVADPDSGSRGWYRQRIRG